MRRAGLVSALLVNLDLHSNSHVVAEANFLLHAPGNVRERHSRYSPFLAMIAVRPTRTEEERQICFGIRREVFVIGQDVPEDEEMDEFDDIVQHYIAFRGDEPVGTGRLRPVDENFIKFERVRVQRNLIDVDSPGWDSRSAACHRESSRCVSLTIGRTAAGVYAAADKGSCIMPCKCCCLCHAAALRINREPASCSPTAR